MKLSTLAVATLVVAALGAGSALAQVTMQPVPNPPENAKGDGHHMGKHHHHHHMAEAKADKKMDK